MHSTIVMTSFNITLYSTRINEGGRGLWWLMECDHDANGEKNFIMFIGGNGNIRMFF
jgi:hypothetical protein